jgi:CO dehydrogenase/acetyl-CoA synthase beta subunit
MDYTGMDLLKIDGFRNFEDHLINHSASNDVEEEEEEEEREAEVEVDVEEQQKGQEDQTTIRQRSVSISVEGITIVSSDATECWV